MSETTIDPARVAPAPAVGRPPRLGAEGPRSAAALVTVVLWASAFVGIRDAGAEISPGPLSLGRLLVASVVLGVARRRAPRGAAAARRRAAPRALQPALVRRLQRDPQHRRAATSTPARRRCSSTSGRSSSRCSPGCCCARASRGRCSRAARSRSRARSSSASATSERGVDAGWGAVLCLAAAAAYAGGVVAQKPLLERTSALQITFLACAIASVACLPFAPDLVHDVRGASRPGRRLDRLPRRVPDRARVHDLGLRAAPHDRRPDGRDDVPRPAGRGRARVGAPGRDAARRSPSRAARCASPGSSSRGAARSSGAAAGARTLRSAARRAPSLAHRRALLDRHVATVVPRLHEPGRDRRGPPSRAMRRSTAARTANAIAPSVPQGLVAVLARADVRLGQPVEPDAPQRVDQQGDLDAVARGERERAEQVAARRGLARERLGEARERREVEVQRAAGP